MYIPHEGIHSMDGKWMKFSPEKEQGQGPLTVLYVEDDASSRHLVRRAFELRDGWQLHLAASLDEAAELMAVNPDIILMDIQLPDGSGFEMLSRLKANPEHSAIPVVAVSAYALREQVADGLAAGFAHYLTKPLDLNKLFAVIDALR
jgi:CheY-like chemotaxis protein